MDFYPRSPCGERRKTLCTTSTMMIISIHALLAESDEQSRQQGLHVPEFLSTLSLRRATAENTYKFITLDISIHALLAESDCKIQPLRSWIAEFLSTLSLRRATDTSCSGAKRICNFYPRSPCGERRLSSSILIMPFHISIHALLAESDDDVKVIKDTITNNFYPRSPCGERLCKNLLIRLAVKHFYPRSPCGERP